MKISWVFWWIVNSFWFILFLIGTFIVWFREIDGAGVIQTPTLKLLSFSILVVAFFIPLFIQIIWLVINLIITKNTNKSEDIQTV